MPLESQKERTQLCTECDCRITKILWKKNRVLGNIGSKFGQDRNSIVTLTNPSRQHMWLRLPQEAVGTKNNNLETGLINGRFSLHVYHGSMI